MEVAALLFIVVQAAALGIIIAANIAATRNWQASLARRIRRPPVEQVSDRTSPQVSNRDSSSSSTPIRRAA